MVRAAISTLPYAAAVPRYAASARADSVELGLEGCECLVEDASDVLVGSSSKPGHHGGVERSEGDRGQDMGTQILLRGDSKASTEGLDDTQPKVLPADVLL